MLRGIYGDDALPRRTGRSTDVLRRRRRADRPRRRLLAARAVDVVNVSGHRISTIEVESALVDHPTSPRPRSLRETTR
jgi:acetyl-CoA synthetase